MAVLVLLLIVITISLTFVAVREGTKDSPKTDTAGALTSNNGLVLAKVGVATYKLPLYTLPILPKDDLEQIQMIAVTLKKANINNESTFYQNTDEGTPHVEYGFRIASYARMNRTFIIFDDYNGNQLTIRNGVVRFRFAPHQFFVGDYRICSSNITCANTVLEGVDVPALQIEAMDELVNISATLDPNEFRHRRQMKVVEFAALSMEFQSSGCMNQESRRALLQCLAVEGNDICYAGKACQSTVLDLLPSCDRVSAFDGVPLCATGSPLTLLETLFNCG